VIRRLIPLGLLLALVLLPAAQAGNPRPCDADRAERATVAQIVADADAWYGRCVAVPALKEGLRLYAGVEAYYRARGRIADPAADPQAWSGVGLDNPRLLRGRIREGFSAVTAIGRVQDCEEMSAAVEASLGPDQIGWVAGYCHYSSGPVIWLRELRHVRRLAPLRHMGERARAAYGDLALAPADWPHHEHVTGRAEAFLTALRDGDRRAFAELHDGGVNLGRSHEAARFAFSPSSPFAEIARAEDPPQMSIFVDRAVQAENPPRRHDAVSATVCFCRSADCTGIWPIARIDADNRRARPYACTRLTPYILLGRTEQIFITEQGERGLAEPAQTAFRRRSESSRR
jgi:hypothetical protein